MQFDICPGCMRSPAAQGVCPSCGFDAGAYEAKSHHLPLYTILDGKYLIGKVLGQGGFGITYLGWDMTLEIKVAIKEYFPSGYVGRNSAASLKVSCNGQEQAEDFFAKGKERSLTEARTMAKCDSIAEVVRVRDFFQANNTVYIIMDFIEGVTLKRYLDSRGGRIAMNECISLLGPVIRAMDTVHRQVGLIHRDISPDNIMVLPDGRVRILDFGAAKNAAAPQTRSSALMLKRGLSPIEQYSDNNAQGPWTDVYAMGATIYYCLTGTLPPEATDRTGTDTIVPPVRRGAVITRQQEWALMRALAVRPADRYQSMADFYRGLTARPQAAPNYQQPLAAPIPAAPPSTPAPAAPVQPAAPAQTQAAPVYNPTAYPQPQQPVYQAAQPVNQRTQAQKKSSTGLIAVIAAAAVLLAGLGIGAALIRGVNNSKEEDLGTAFLADLPETEDEEDNREDTAPSGGTENIDLDQSNRPDISVFAPDAEQADYSTGDGGRVNNMVNGNFFFDVDVEGQSYTLYYADSNMVHYREDDDGVVELNNGEMSIFLNYTADGLYYIGYDGAQTQIRFTDHSSGGTKVLHETAKSVMYLTYHDGWLYFTENDNICRINKDGTGYASLYSGGDISDMACHEGNIYWLEDYELCTMPISGGEKSVLYSVADLYFFQFHNGRIYCVRDDDIIALDEDGRIQDTLDISTYYFNIYKDVLYYADYDDHGVYAYDLDSQETVMLTEDHGGNPLRLCVGEYNGLITIWFFYVDSEDVSHAMMLIEQADEWMCVYVDDLL